MGSGECGFQLLCAVSDAGVCFPSWFLSFLLSSVMRRSVDSPSAVASGAGQGSQLQVLGSSLFDAEQRASAARGWAAFAVLTRGQFKPCNFLDSWHD